MTKEGLHSCEERIIFPMNEPMTITNLWGKKLNNLYTPHLHTFIPLEKKNQSWVDHRFKSEKQNN